MIEEAIHGLVATAVIIVAGIAAILWFLGVSGVRARLLHPAALVFLLCGVAGLVVASGSGWVVNTLGWGYGAIGILTIVGQVCACFAGKQNRTGVVGISALLVLAAVFLLLMS